MSFARFQFALSDFLLFAFHTVILKVPEIMIVNYIAFSLLDFAYSHQYTCTYHFYIVIHILVLNYSYVSTCIINLIFYFFVLQFHIY